MCDYSLGGLPNRLAVEGEELIAHRFRTGSMGLASAADLMAAEPLKKADHSQSFWAHIRHLFGTEQPRTIPAVCVCPGACLLMRNIPADLQRQWNVGAEEEVTFIQTSAEVNTYRDAVELRNGRRVHLQELRAGMRLDVLSLAGVAERVPSTEAVQNQA